MSYHNMRDFGTTSAHRRFAGLRRLAQGGRHGGSRDPRAPLGDWTAAPGARHAHPREEHLIPLMVVAGAAGDDVGRITFNDDLMSARVSAVQYG